MPNISANIFAKCSTALGTGIDTCGALTACDVKHVESDQLDAIYTDGSGNYRVLGQLLEADFLGKAYGAKENGLYDFLSTHTKILGNKRLTVSPVGAGLWEIAPFIRMQRNRNVNNNYWIAKVDAATSGYNQTSNIVLRVSSQSSIPLDTRWFPAGMRFFVLGKNAGSGSPATGDTAYRLAFTVVSCTVHGSGTYLVVTAAPQNAASVWIGKAAAASQNKAKVPTTLAIGDTLGVLVRGTPNVTDYESFCAQIPGLNNTQLVPFWLETTRYSMCEDELTNKYLAALRDSNPYFKMFGDVETVKLNKQIIEDFQRRHAWNIFFNKPYNANQTLADYNALPTITLPTISGLAVPAVEGRCVGRRANATGLYEQLSECDRVVDIEAADLDVRQLLNSLYYLQRNREAAGVPSDIIELYTDSLYARQLAYAIMQYMANQFPKDANNNSMFRISTAVNSGKAEQGPFGFRYYVFDLDFPVVQLRIVFHRFFDDLITAHTAAGIQTAGRSIWAIDWTSIYPGVIDSNTVVNKSGNLQDLAAVDDTFMCVMKVPTRTQRLTSNTYTLINEAENTSFVLENLSDTISVPTGQTNSAYIAY